MPSIKDSINDVYGEHRFNEELQQQTIKKMCTSKVKKRPKRNVFIAIAIVAIVFILALSNSQPIEKELTSTTHAPYNADDALLERYQEFQLILADGVISDAERRNYIAKSDWDLQLAFETGTSIFYNRPNITNEDVTLINDTLHKMYRFVYESHPIEGPVQDLQPIHDFQRLLNVLPSFQENLAQHIESQYETSLLEKPLTNNKFLNESWWMQLLIGGFFLLFVYLFIQNIRIDQKILAGVLQILFIVFIGQFFFHKDDTFYSYDETALMQSAIQHAEKINEPYEIQDLIAIAQYSNTRYALVSLTDGRYMMLHFTGDDYTFKGTASGDSNLIMSNGGFEEEGWATAVAVVDSSNVSAVAKWDENFQEEYRLTLQNKPDIYLLTVPDKATNTSLYFYGKNGEVLE